MRSEIEVLKQLGLSEKEVKTYLAALEYGPLTIAQLAKRSGIKRTSVYNFLDEIINRGFLIVSVSGRNKLYSATPPNDLLVILERQRDKVERIIPELLMLSDNSSGPKPRIRFYEGIEGLKKVYDDTLNQPNGSEILAFATFEGVYKTFSESFRKSYLKKRAKEKNIFAKAIIPSDDYSQVHISADKDEMRETIALPKKDFPINNEINIYQDKVAIISFEDKIGVIIESAQIANTQRIIFNSFWGLLKKNK